MDQCPICLSQAENTVFSDTNHNCRCDKCGTYRTTGTALRLLELHGHGIDRNRLSDLVRRLADQSEPEIPFVNEDWLNVAMVALRV